MSAQIPLNVSIHLVYAAVLAYMCPYRYQTLRGDVELPFDPEAPRGIDMCVDMGVVVGVALRIDVLIDVCSYAAMCIYTCE